MFMVHWITNQFEHYFVVHQLVHKKINLLKSETTCHHGYNKWRYMNDKDGRVLYSTFLLDILKSVIELQKLKCYQNFIPAVYPTSLWLKITCRLFNFPWANFLFYSILYPVFSNSMIFLITLHRNRRKRFLSSWKIFLKASPCVSSWCYLLFSSKY